MYCEPKIENPLIIVLNSHGNVLLRDRVNKEDIPLEKGVMIGSNNFGFTIIANVNNEPQETTYATQYRIQATEIKDGELILYEENKYIPWRFTAKGVFKNKAVFLPTSRRDTDFLASEYGITSEEAIAEENSYSPKL